MELNRSTALLIGVGFILVFFSAITAPSASQELTKTAEIEEQWELENVEWGEQTATLTYTTDSIPENVTTQLEFEQVGVNTEILSVNQDGLDAEGLTVSGETTDETLAVRMKFTFEGVSDADNFISTKGILFRNPSPDIQYAEGITTYKSSQTDNRSRSISVNNQVEYYKGGPTEFTRHFIYIGIPNRAEPQVRQFEVDGTTVTTYTPDYTFNNVSDSNIEWVEAVFTQMQQTLNTDDVNTDRILMTSTPSVTRNGGQTWDRLNSDVYVWGNEDAFINPDETLVAHEFIHTYQKHRVADDMEWWIEGSASYFGGMYTLSSTDDPHEEYISDQTFSNRWYEHREFRNQSYSNMTANNPESWEYSFEYTRPPRIVFLIDVAIREHTDGEKTVIDVFHWMNQQNGPIRYAAFRSYIVSQTDQEFGERLDGYMTTTEEINYKQEAEEISGDTVSEPFVLPVKSEQPLEEPYNKELLDKEETTESDAGSNQSDPDSGGISIRS